MSQLYVLSFVRHKDEEVSIFLVLEDGAMAWYTGFQLFQLVKQGRTIKEVSFTSDGIITSNFDRTDYDSSPIWCKVVFHTFDYDEFRFTVSKRDYQELISQLRLSAQSFKTNIGEPADIELPKLEIMRVICTRAKEHESVSCSLDIEKLLCTVNGAVICDHNVDGGLYAHLEYDEFSDAIMTDFVCLLGAVANGVDIKKTDVYKVGSDWHMKYLR